MWKTISARIRIILLILLYGFLILSFNFFLQLPITISIILTLILGILLGLLIRFLATKPITDIEQISRRIASGNFDIRVETDPKEEFFTLKQSFNQMIEGFGRLLLISQLLAKEHSLDKLLNLIIDEITNLMHAQRTTLFLYNEETNELWSYIAQELEIKEIRLPVGKGIAGYTAETGEIVNIKDAYSDDRFDREIDKVTGFRTRNILCVPMFNHMNKLLGVIQVLNKIDGNFAEYDESLLKAVTPQCGVAIENAQLYTEQENLLRSLIKTLVATIDARDPVTSGHSERVSRYAMSIGRTMKLSENELKVLEYSALLHDVGKIGIKDAILSKPSEYTPEEYEAVRQHPLITKDILEKVYFTDDQKQIPLLASIHHEKLDGSGYPLGLKSDNIPLIARIIAVADVYDAIVSYDRPYKPAMPVEKALRILEKDSEKNKFDKNIVDIFIDNKLYELERREYVRITKELSIEYRVIGPEEWRNIIPIIAKTKNISGNGLLFTTKDLLYINNFLEVRIHLPQFTIDVLAKIVRKNEIKKGHEIGISFINLGPEAKKRIQKYLVDF